MTISFSSLSNEPIQNLFKDFLNRRSKDNIGLLFNINNNIRQAILDDRVSIISTKRIDFNKLLNENKITDIEFKNLIKLNSTIENGIYDLEVNSKEFLTVITKLNMLISDDGTIISIQETDQIAPSRHIKPIKAKEDLTMINDEDVKYFIPKHDFDYAAFMLNFFNFGNNVKYKYMKCTTKKINDNYSYLQKNALEITGAREIVRVPTKYKVTCTHKNGLTECGNIVSFCDMHKHSNIYCSDSIYGIFDKESKHTIKNIEKATISDTVTLYLYTARDLSNPEQKEEFVVASINKIDDTYIYTNGFLHYVEGTTTLYVISHKPIENTRKKLEKEILKKDNSKFFFLNDVIKSIKEYYEEYHNIKISNANKIVAEVIIFQLLANKFFDYNFKAFVLGTSGSGKTFWSKVLLPLFTNRFAVLQGDSLTRNRYLGGRSNMLSKLYNSTFSAGFVATNDLLFVEETAEQLEKFHDPRFTDLSNNIFSMDKRVGNKGEKYDVGIQGSTKLTVKATTFLTGNIESMMTLNNEYSKRLSKIYRTITGGSHVPPSAMLYKPIEFYSKILKNENLAKSHLKVRKDFYWNKNYITSLPTAEQARKEIFIALEEDKFERQDLSDLNTTKIVDIQPHREEFIAELAKIFENKKSVPIKFKNDIEMFMKNEFFYTSRNNFCRDKQDKVNTHIIISQINLCVYLIYMNKLYYDLPIEFTNDDKELIRYFESFNYNTLSSKEASMIIRPRFVNDFYLNTEEVNNEIEKIEEDANLNRLVDSKKQDGINLDDNTVFDKALTLNEKNKDDLYD